MHHLLPYHLTEHKQTRVRWINKLIKFLLYLFFIIFVLWWLSHSLMKMVLYVWQCVICFKRLRVSSKCCSAYNHDSCNKKWDVTYVSLLQLSPSLLTNISTIFFINRIFEVTVKVLLNSFLSHLYQYRIVYTLTYSSIATVISPHSAPIYCPCISPLLDSIMGLGLLN